MNLFLTHKWETEYYALAQPSMEIRFPHSGRIQISTPPFNMVFYTSKETAMEIPIKRSNVNFTLLLMPRTCFGSMLFKISFLRNICLCNGNCHNRSEQKYQIFWNHMNFLLVLLGLMRFSWIFLGTSYCTCHHLEIIEKCVLEIGEWALCFHALLWLLCVDIYCPWEWLDRGIFDHY